MKKDEFSCRHLTVGDLAERTGWSDSWIGTQADRKHIPGMYRTAGGQRRFNDRGGRLNAWIDLARGWHRFKFRKRFDGPIDLTPEQIRRAIWLPENSGPKQIRRIFAEASAKGELLDSDRAYQLLGYR